MKSIKQIMDCCVAPALLIAGEWIEAAWSSTSSLQV